MMWIGDIFEFLATTKFVPSSLSIIFFLFILLNVLFRLKEKDFTDKVNKNLRILICMFSIYVLFVLVVTSTIERDTTAHAFIFVIYTQLCGAIILWCLFIFSTILRFSKLKTVLLGIPIGFFGVPASYFLCAYLPHFIFPKTEFGSGHVPGEFFFIDVLLLMAYSLFISGRNSYKKIRGVK